MGLIADAQRRREWDETAQDRQMAREERQLGLDSMRQQATDNTERRRIVQEATTDPVIRDYDAADNAQTIDRSPRKMTLDDQMNLYEKLGEHDLRTGRQDPEKSMRMRAELRNMETEGHFDAYNEYRKTKDINAALKMFNTRGKTKLDPKAKIGETEKVDPLTGQPYTTYTMQSEDGRTLTFDPLQTAREAGGAKGWLDQQRTAFEARKSAVAERRASNMEAELLRRGTRDEARTAALDAETRRRSTRDDARYETDQRRLDIMEARGGREGGGGVFGYKMGVLERAAPHLSEMDRYKLASGQRNIPAAQMAKWAEDAISRQEKLTGIPLKPEDRKRKVGEQMQFYRSFAEDPGAIPSLKPPSNGGAPKDYSNLWGGT